MIVLSSLPAGWRLLGAMALAGAAPAAHALDPVEWQQRQPLRVDRAGIVKFALPPATLDTARPLLEDLRLVDPAGREVPYLVERAAPAAPPTVRAPAGFRVDVRDTGTEITLTTGSETPLLSVALATPASGFLKAARVEVTNDGETWETLATGAPLFRQFGAEQLQVLLGHRRATQLRITVDDRRSAPVPFTGAILFHAPTVVPPVSHPLPTRLAQRDEFAGESVLTLDLGARQVPLAELEFVTTEPLFARQVNVTVRELRNETAVERRIAGGAIYRVSVDGLPASARLRLPIEAVVPAREILIHILNHDSPPLAIEEVRAHQRPVWLIFRAAEAGTFSLLTGNPDAAAPRYDLATLAGSLRGAEPSSIVPGPAEATPGYRRVDSLATTALIGATIDPTSWTRRKAVQLGAAGVQLLELDVDVLAGAQPDFGDLRLVRERTQIPYLLERPAVSRAVEVALVSANDPAKPRVSRWELALPRAGLPVARVTLTSSTPLFQRQVRVFERVTIGAGAQQERSLAHASWSHAPGNTPPLVLVLDGTPMTDRLVVEMDNGDNPAVNLGQTAQAHYPVTRLLFKTEPGPLSLHYGNARAATPRYDLALVAPQILSAEKHVATLGAEESSQRGWAAGTLAGLRGGVVFWVVLGLVVVVLLAVIARLLPKPPA